MALELLQVDEPNSPQHSLLDSEASAAFAAPSFDNVLAIFGTHTGAETRSSLTLAASAAEGPLSHNKYSSLANLC